MLSVLLACLCVAGGVAVPPVPVPAPAPAQPAGLSMGVTNELESVAFGEAVRYVVTLRNDGPAPQRVTVRLTAPRMLLGVQAAGGQAAALRAVAEGLFVWPAVVPARGQSTVEIRARVGRTYARTNTVTVTACGLPDGTDAPAVCATDVDDLLVRRRSAAAAVPWLLAGVVIVLLIAGGVELRRRRSRPAAG